MQTYEGIAMQFTRSKGYLTIQATEEGYSFIFYDSDLHEIQSGDYDNPDGDKYEYNLSENENFENLNAVEMGRLYKYGDGFKFQALGSGYTGGMTELFKNFGLDIDEGRD